eukprot:CAMPEP_0179191238 /NCGR_PEP_ID=MMETSP0796-20121207/94982_1 /TAXON_ID=73915 /ORGANISM="Pyrodinium bahamense, Strain pbaha01" /LENGTH=250 /DNA_ID=CAMNT_0020895453 /DNA_START=56 /DNA_END=809 /DNA_ORIENTATION=+
MPDWETVKNALPTSKSEEHRKQREELWDQFNITKSKYLALFEVDAGIQKVLQCEELFDAKPAIQRAFQYAREVNPGGPKDKLEFCEFRLLLVYLKGLFEVYQLFVELDKNATSSTDLEAAGPRLAAAGIQVPDPAALWRKLRGTNDAVEFGEFADWATRQGLAGPELLELERTNDAKADQELSRRLKALLNGWSRCHSGAVAVDDMKALLRRLHPACANNSLDQLLGCSTDGSGKVRVDSLVDSIVFLDQ